MFITTSKVDSTSANSFIKCLYASVLAYNVEYGATMKQKIRQWTVESQLFCKRFGIHKKFFDNLMNEIAAGTDPSSSAKLENKIINLAKELKEKKLDLKQEIDLSKQQLGQINDFILFNSSDSKDRVDNALNRMHKNVVTLGDPELTSLFNDDEEELDSKGLSSIKQRLKKLVKAIVKREDLVLTVKESQDNKDHPKYKEYLKVRRELVALYRQRLKQLVRSSGKHTMDVEEVKRVLKKEQIPHTIPDGFVGKVDETGWLYTVADKKLKSNPKSSVTMNPKYDPYQDNAYVMTGLPYEGAGEQRYYTEDYRAGKIEAKFDVMNDLIKHMDKIRKKWQADLRTKGSNSIKALILEIIYQTSARVSSEKAKSKGQQTYGITTLKVKHVKIKSNKIHIKYPAKSSVLQHYILTADDVVTKQVKLLLEQQMDEKQPDDYIMTDYNGNRITGNMVNKYLRSIGAPADATIHKFRHVRGTTLAKQLLEKSPFNKSNKDYNEKEVHTWFIDQMKKIGEELGHKSGENVTANTAIANYIEPNIMKEFFDNLNVRMPPTVKRAIDSAKKR